MKTPITPKTNNSRIFENEQFYFFHICSWVWRILVMKQTNSEIRLIHVLAIQELPNRYLFLFNKVSNPESKLKLRQWFNSTQLSKSLTESIHKTISSSKNYHRQKKISLYFGHSHALLVRKGSLWIIILNWLMHSVKIRKYDNSWWPESGLKSVIKIKDLV